MRLLSDDEIYTSSNEWLGPKGFTLGWRARYSAYAVGLFVFIIVLAIQRKMGVSANLLTMALALMITVIITRWLMSFVTFEQPVRGLVSAFWHEISSPRESNKEKVETFKATKLRIEKGDESGARRNQTVR